MLYKCEHMITNIFQCPDGFGKNVDESHESQLNSSETQVYKRTTKIRRFMFLNHWIMIKQDSNCYLLNKSMYKVCTLVDGLMTMFKCFIFYC